jgi:hypothetical protein
VIGGDPATVDKHQNSSDNQLATVKVRRACACHPICSSTHLGTNQGAGELLPYENNDRTVSLSSALAALGITQSECR